MAKAFGSAVRDLRVEKKLTQRALAQEAAISYVGKIERGEHIPNLLAVVQLAGAFDCTVADLIGRFEAHLYATATNAHETT